jgi:transcriptional regulator of acetoin/glycerol metabolism
MATDRPAPLPAFALTAAQRSARAREQFFEQGLRPSGWVSEPVIQSWARCQRAGAETSRRLAFNPVTRSRIHSTLGRSRSLLQAAEAELARLEQSLAATDCRVLLTDPEGVVVHATRRDDAGRSPTISLAGRVGVDISEAAVGTNAPGIVVNTGQAVTVSGAEHYFDCVHVLHCAAAPIRDTAGRLAGVLDLTIEARPFGFDAAAVVALYAVSIENRLLLAHSAELLVVRLHTDPALLATPLAGLLALHGDGRLAWANAAALRLLGSAEPDAPGTDRLGATLPTLLALARLRGPAPRQLPNGLGVWIEVAAPQRDGAPAPIVAAGTVPGAAADRPPGPSVGSTLGEQRQALIRAALAEHHGNVAAAARALGVSRGLVYRTLRDPAQPRDA